MPPADRLSAIVDLIGGNVAEERRRRTWYIERQKQRRRAKIQRYAAGTLLVAGVAAIAGAVLIQLS